MPIFAPPFRLGGLEIPVPRLLPLAMVLMACLIVLKSAHLVQASTGQPAATAPVTTPSVTTPSVTTPAAAQSLPPPAKPPLSPKATPPASPSAPRPVEAGPASIPPAPAPAPSEAPAAPVAQPMTDSERALLEDLRQRREQLEKREAALAQREQALAALQKRLAARVDELQAMQGQLQGLETARKAQDETNWRGLVKVYETMKPRDAATIFNDLDQPVLLAVLDRMKDAKAAAILAAMQPDRARQATAELADMRIRANTPVNTAPATLNPTKVKPAPTP